MSRDLKEIICPFYKDETAVSIRCEGMISDTCTNTFQNSTKKEKYKYLFCKTFDYPKCILARQLLKQYEIEDEVEFLQIFNKIYT